MDESLLGGYAHLPISELVDQIAAESGRPIIVIDSDFAGLQRTLCGLWLGLPEVDLIFVADDLEGIHRDHVVLHELAHLLLNHKAVAEATIEEVASLFPSLPPSLVSRVLRRSHYDDVQEAAAEELASMIAARTRGSNRSAWVNDPISRQIAQILGHSP